MPLIEATAPIRDALKSADMPWTAPGGPVEEDWIQKSPGDFWKDRRRKDSSHDHEMW